ncbi:SDR family NAD(P)-dependent oxidoreductase [Nocardia farcinica]|uniref:SDR family NAD(P)-dependent oxidoreductase n=1 Tax=Nocardia farcinica TaxID=37329 RepID=UPI003788CAB7
MTECNVAMVTGAARGIGRRTAHVLSADGYALALVDMAFDGYREFDDDQEADVRTELGRNGTTIWAEAATDDAAAMDSLVEEVLSKWGHLDALVCNAGGGSGPLDGNRASEIDITDLTDVLRTNLIGTITTVTAALPALERSSNAAIVTMSSLNGIEPTDNGRYAHYGIAKAAVAHYTRYLSRDLREKGIRANCIAPGPVTTGRLNHRMRESPTANADLSQAVGRFGTATEVAELVRYLVSERSRYMNGQVIRLDGGA